MENRIINKTIILLFCIFAGISISSCSDWTDTEGMTVVDPNIKEQNPELYAKYLEDLRKYKASHHKAIYAWFDNSEKVPFNRAQHIDNVPDSIDVLVLMYPTNLVERELNEINTVRQEKGMKIMFSVDYDAIKLNYDEMTGASQGDEVKSFELYLADTLSSSLRLIDKYDYNGILVGYKGKSMQHMTDAEKEDYTTKEKVFIGILSGWYNMNQDKLLVFEGNPQNLIDKTILKSCQHIVIPTIAITNTSAMTYNVTMACEEDVPTDRFIVTATTTSLDATDTKTGYWSDGSRAISSTAQWASASHSGYAVAGLGVYNINNDYYNTLKVYQYTRKAIDVLNPSLKAK